MSDCLQVREFVQVKFTLTNWADFYWNFVFRQIASINRSIDIHSMPTSHGPFKKKCEESYVLGFQEFTFVAGPPWEARPPRPRSCLDFA